jgi:hypothetical protein
MFALRLYHSTARSIARAYGAKLSKGAPAEIGANATLLWAHDWLDGRPGGGWLLVTQSRQDAERVFTPKNAPGEAGPPTAVAVAACPPAGGRSRRDAAVDHLAPIWEAIQATLDDIAKMCVTPEEPWGLRCYLYSHRKHIDGSFPENRWEEGITAGLARGLRDKGIRASTERPYPGSSERCDLVVQLSGGETLWIECKTAYRMDLGGDLDGGHPKESVGKSSWREGVADVARKDIQKLDGLRLPTAQYVGVLLLGFDRDRKGQSIETDDLYSLLPGELRGGRWVAAHGEGRPEGLVCRDRYSCRAEKGYRDRLWFWYRPVAKVQSA